MRFPYKKFPLQPAPGGPRPGYVLRPVIPIRLQVGQRYVSFEALIDSGADFCIFHASLGEIVGLDIRSGREVTFHGVAGIKQHAYFHAVQLEMGGTRFPCRAAFSPQLKTPYGILGQTGFFDWFKVEFDLGVAQVRLRPRP